MTQAPAKQTLKHLLKRPLTLVLKRVPRVRAIAACPVLSSPVLNSPDRSRPAGTHIETSFQNGTNRFSAVRANVASAKTRDGEAA